MYGYVYLICEPLNETYKIGVTRNPQCKRIKSLQVGNSQKLHIVKMVKTLYPFRLETMLHNNYKDKKLEGEWFQLTINDVLQFEQVCKKYIDIMHNLKNNPYFMDNIK